MDIQFTFGAKITAVILVWVECVLYLICDPSGFIACHSCPNVHNNQRLRPAAAHSLGAVFVVRMFTLHPAIRLYF